MHRRSLLVVGLFVALIVLGDSAVVQRRYRSVQDVLIPVTVIQDGEVFPEIPKPSAELKSIVEDIPKSVEAEEEKEKHTKIPEIPVEGQRRIDDEILEEKIKEVVEEENKELLKALLETQAELEKAKEKEQEQEAASQEEKKPSSEETSKEQAEDKNKSSQDKENSDESILQDETKEEEEEDNDKKEELEGSLRQATQATPSQTTTQQNFVQQLIQNSPLGQFFNQISGQTTQGQVANDDAAAATPSPTIPGFLAPAINAAQTVVNTTTTAFQGLQQFASNLGNQFQNTLSGLGGQQPAQQNAGDATTARPAGPFQQLVNTFMGNNNNQQATPAPQQGPLQGLLNIFQGNNNNNNNNNNKPQSSEPSANLVQASPVKQPEIAEEVTEAAPSQPNTAEELSNEVRSSAETEDSFEEAVQPEEMIVVQDDASQSRTDHK